MKYLRGSNLDYSHFDSFFDAIAAFDSGGVIVYCNEPFSQIVGMSPNRIINKSTITKLFMDFDGSPVSDADLKVQETSNIRVVHFKTKTVDDGVGQYCLIPVEHEGKKITLFVMRDLTLEEQLKSKYKREMDSKDRKIEEMKSLINLLQKTRLVKEPLHLLKEFGLHILSQFKLDRAYLITPEKVVSGIFTKDRDLNDPLLTTIGKADIPPYYVVYTSKELPSLNIGQVPGLEKLIVVPVRAQQKTVYMLVVPVYAEQVNNFLDHETIDTLGEQMSLMLENMALEKLSIYDDLTKLYNARFFREKLDEYSSNYVNLFLILLDIDLFKKVNDTYGHLAGDLVLQTMGATLKQNCTLKDSVVARVGGEEFAILLPNQTIDSVVKFAEELGNKIRALNIPFEDKILRITSSFGISTWEIGKMAVRDFYKAADAALYESKKNGRDRVTVHKKAS